MPLGVPVLDSGERHLERDLDHPPEPRLVRVRRVAPRAGRFRVRRSVDDTPGRGNCRGFCIVIGCPLSVLIVVLLSDLAVVQLL